ncbi:MAG TPA: hypothetical protein VD793_06975, partial [Gemmatimonadales bacterium]|nr:hypothetical protein [Gemmatimonadales bacterium]
GLADTPFVADLSDLLGTAGDGDAISRAATAATDGVEANEDIHASASYRLHLARVAARRALAQALERAGQR